MSHVRSDALRWSQRSAKPHRLFAEPFGVLPTANTHIPRMGLRHSHMAQRNLHCRVGNPASYQIAKGKDGACNAWVPPAQTPLTALGRGRE